MIAKNGLRKRYELRGRTIDERRLRRLFCADGMSPLDEDQFRALLFDLLVEEIAKGETPWAETIAEMLADTGRDQDDLDAAVQRKKRRLKCQSAHMRRVAAEYYKIDIGEVCKADLDSESSEAFDEHDGLAAKGDGLSSPSTQSDAWEKVLATQERALLQIAVLLDRLDELENETFDVDAPDYVRIDELKSVTQRLRAKIDADHDDSPETKADLENAEQELRVLREIRDDQHLPTIMGYRLSKLTGLLNSEFGDLVYHPWPLTKPTARRRHGSGGAL